MNRTCWQFVLPLLLSACLGNPPARVGASTSDLPNPLVIGHRGAPGHLPEHTLESYALAIELGADCIEPDLVSTRDGYLVARHEPNLIATTDVAKHPEFADRRTTRSIDGVVNDGFFASDFTLAELKTLRAIQALPNERFTGLDGAFRIPTLMEVIRLAKSKSRQKGRTICIYPETKNPTHHRSLGLPLEDALVQTLERAGWNHADAPVFIQSFEQANLVYLNTITEVRLVQLLGGGPIAAGGGITYVAPFDRPHDWHVAGREGTYGDLASPSGLDEIAQYADGIGAWKPYVLRAELGDADQDGRPDDRNADGRIDDRDRTLTGPTSLVADAHARGLLVHAWTFRSEPHRLASEFVDRPASELRAYYAAGVDGVFTDHPGEAVAARTQFLLQEEPAISDCLIDPAASKSPRCRNLAPGVGTRR